MKYYLYRHIRLDKNEPFYIGIGRKRKVRNVCSWSHEYERAYVNGKGRSKLWNRIAAKGYEIEILFETNNHKLILKKEIEFINLYGRIDLNTGSLSNFTSGGEGIVSPSVLTRKLISEKLTGLIRSEKTRQKIKEKRKLQKHPTMSKEARLRLSKDRTGSKNVMFGKTGLKNVKSKNIYEYDKNQQLIKVWVNAREIEKEKGICYKKMSYSCLTKTPRNNRLYLYTPLNI